MGVAIGLAAVHAQSPRFRAKLDSALGIVGRALRESRRPYIAFSGGVDSVAVCGLVHALRPDVPLAWSDDELEYPENLDYLTRLKALAGGQLMITLGWAEHAGWFRPWTDAPYWREPLPGTIGIEQDMETFYAGLGYDLTFLGLRMDENRRRRDWLGQAGPLYNRRAGTGRACCPIWDWSRDDVWALVAAWGLGYSAAYDRYEEIGVPRHRQRTGPLPLAPREHLADGWPELLARLEARYGPRWR